MKKILAFALTLCMVLALCACGSAAAPAATQAPAATEAPAAEAAPEATEAPVVEEAPAAADVKVGLIFLHDENSTYDANFMNAALEVIDEMGLPYVIKTQVPEDQTCYDTAADLADEGCTVIFSDSYGHQSYMLQAAQDYPEVQFVSATGDLALATGLENYHNAFAHIYMGRYLVGVVAGLKLNEMIEAGTITEDQAKLGYVGAYAYAEVKSGYTSFFLGARSVCPTATMEVTFTNSWYDEALEKEAAEKLISNGCVVLSQHADSYGAPSACEAAGVPNVSYNLDTSDAAPTTYLAASRIYWAPYFRYMLGQMVAGEAFDTDWCGTIEQGSVEVISISANATAGAAEKVEEVKAQLINGEINVFDTANFTVGGETITNAFAIDTDGDWVNDTSEAVIDGVFQESLYRSAPYFALDIDGITILGE